MIAIRLSRQARLTWPLALFFHVLLFTWLMLWRPELPAPIPQQQPLQVTLVLPPPEQPAPKPPKSIPAPEPVSKPKTPTSKQTKPETVQLQATPQEAVAGVTMPPPPVRQELSDEERKRQAAAALFLPPAEDGTTGFLQSMHCQSPEKHDPACDQLKLGPMARNLRYGEQVMREGAEISAQYRKMDQADLAKAFSTGFQYDGPPTTLRDPAMQPNLAGSDEMRDRLGHWPPDPVFGD